MTVEEFAKWQTEQTAATGTRPSAVHLNNEDVRSIMDELQASVTSVAVDINTPRFKADDAAYQRSISRRPGYCMTLLGTDVYRTGDVAIGTIAAIE
jgi:hypothetical protein